MNEKKNSDFEIISSIEMQAEIDQREEPEQKLLSNIPSLDKAIEGFVQGELIVISGPTKNGKTLFGQSLTNEFTKQSVFPLWFSFEVTPKYFLMGFPELPLFYMPRKLKMNAMDWVVSKMHESFKKYHTRVIFIDHLHYLFDIARTKNPSIEIGTIIRRLKLVAVEYGYIIFLLCHTKKGASDNEKLTYELIRDSSFVSQESDTVLMIARDVKNPMSNNAWVSVEFHRRTGILHKVIDLVKVNGYLREFSKHESKSEGDLIQ
jgi:replicative DNA helicase